MQAEQQRDWLRLKHDAAISQVKIAEDKATSADDRYKQLNIELDQIKLENDERLSLVEAQKEIWHQAVGEFEKQAASKDLILLEVYHGDTDAFLGEAIINSDSNQEVSLSKIGLLSRKDTAGRKPDYHKIENFVAVKREEEDMGSIQAIIDVINFNEDGRKFQKYFIRSIFRLKS